MVRQLVKVLTSLLLISCATSFRGPENLTLPEFSIGKEDTSIKPTESLEHRDPAALPPLNISGKLDWPVDKARLTQGFIPSGKNRHKGIDLADTKGTPIYAAHDGKVIYTGRGFSGYGKLIILEFNEKWSTFYSHLDKIFVKEGEWVTKGKSIAAMGRTGRASGNHLHFELRYEKNPVDPTLYLP